MISTEHIPHCPNCGKGMKATLIDLYFSSIMPKWIQKILLKKLVYLIQLGKTTNYVIRTDKNNELLSSEGRIIVFFDKQIPLWFLGLTTFGTNLPTFATWKIEEYEEKFDSIKHMTDGEWMGEEAMLSIIKRR